MARKETYRAKFEQRLADETGNPLPERVRQKKPPLHPSIQQTFLEGQAILIDKPMHWTSFDIVRKLRSTLQIKKIGHAGTLDPLATGLLIVCTGKFTKKINEYMASEKEYTGEITLGAVTPTYDLESTPEDFKSFENITETAIYNAVEQFLGTIDQYPPIYSAIKKDGVALYELARRGEAVDLKARTITIHQFEITQIDLPKIQFKVVCSTGTYIRSLAHDFGKALGCGGYLSALRRTRIGDFSVSDAQLPENFMQQIDEAHAAMEPSKTDNLSQL
ncbi:MAG: tRNA pseudouridine(55) synthase TruB [Ferruginibacter sp.]